MSKTEQNLRDAFAGESQANRKYLAFAKKAETDLAARCFPAGARADAQRVRQVGHRHHHVRWDQCGFGVQVQGTPSPGGDGGKRAHPAPPGAAARPG